MNYELINAHTFSCNLRFFLRKVFYLLFEVFTYSLVCQYVKELMPSTIYDLIPTQRQSGEYRGRTDDLLHAMQAL